jgi:ankyrin repeat protein
MTSPDRNQSRRTWRRIGLALLGVAVAWSVMVWVGHFRSLGRHETAHGYLVKQQRDLLRRLLDGAIDVNEPPAVADNDRGDTMLMIAMAAGDLETATMLLDAGADVEAWNDRGRTALMQAALRSDVESIELLIARGADVDAINRFGRNALHLAAERGDADAVGGLLEHGADPRHADADRSTALHGACERHGAPGSVARLLAAGADIDARSRYGQTPLLITVAHLNRSERIDEQMEKLDLLLAAGADVTMSDALGQTPLVKAARYHHDAVVRLLEAGAVPELFDDLDRSPLYTAVVNAQAETVTAILDRMPTMPDVGQLAVLRRRAERRGDEDIIRLLEAIEAAPPAKPL